MGASYAQWDMCCSKSGYMNKHAEPTASLTACRICAMCTMTCMAFCRVNDHFKPVPDRVSSYEVAHHSIIIRAGFLYPIPVLASCERNVLESR